jgi:hypothetical protein
VGLAARLKCVRAFGVPLLVDAGGFAAELLSRGAPRALAD